jgi:hypothetical protein
MEAAKNRKNTIRPSPEEYLRVKRMGLISIAHHPHRRPHFSLS